MAKMRGGLSGCSPGSAAIQRWRSAQSWRRAVDRELRDLDLTFSRWFVLDATAASIRLAGDAVSQREVARYAEMPEMTVCNVMWSLTKRGWVDRDINSLIPAWRVLLTSHGTQVLQQGRERIEAVSARWAAG
jgi:hypothetical protein